jgi:hypothetical protein
MSITYRLRSEAERYGLAAPQTATLMMEAADTIWELRDDLQRANAENAKMRKLVREWRKLAVYGADSLSDWIEIQADLESRMRELGIEVDV